MVELQSKSLGPEAQKYFTPLPVGGGLKSGDLISFNYTNYKNDPNPLIIIIKETISNKQKISGINLHYLTYPIIRQLLLSYVDKPLSYQSNVKTNAAAIGAYRCYKTGYIQQIKKMDKDFIMRVMNVTRTFDEVDNQLIKKQIDLQKEKETGQETAEGLVSTAPTTIGQVPTIGQTSVIGGQESGENNGGN